MRLLPLFALAACSLQTNPLAVALFGPPAPVLAEAYAADLGAATVDHAALDALLAAHVREGFVDYAGLAADRPALQAYIRALEAAPFADLSRDEKLALLINAYNAWTLELILDHGIPASIKDIPAAERWDAPRWRLAGQALSLTALEHEWLRARFVEPRIHFAINCASASCPPLRAEAYTAARLEAQLEDQARQMHADPRHLRLEGDTVHLSALYLWYADDFSQVAGSPLAYAARYRPELAAGAWRVQTLDYDWSLNAAPPAPPPR
jgi:hypothetical protein